MDLQLIQQIFKQVMYGIAAHTINNQLLRKELCNWSKAMQIRLVARKHSFKGLCPHRFVAFRDGWIYLSLSFCYWFCFGFRYNVSQLEEWIRKSGLNDAGLKEMLEPLVQASQLLQVKKQAEQDAVEICEMCTELAPVQVIDRVSSI